MDKVQSEIVAAMALVTLGYLSYWYTAESRVLRQWAQRLSGADSRISDIVLQRMLGVLFMGMLPLIACLLLIAEDPDRYGLGAGDLRLTALWSAALSGLIVLITAFSARKPDNLAMYPQIRVSQWPGRLILLSALTWILYLLAYEFLFRGVLFFVLLEHTGLWGAMAINACVYALAHLPKGKKETLGAIPFGILICWLSFDTGSIWLAVAVHIVLALSNEWFSLRYHPEIQVIRS